MKILRIIFFSLFLFTFIIAQPFEGKVSMKIVSDETMEMDYFTKGTNIRIEMNEKSPENMGAFIFNMKENKILIIMPEQKMYMEMPLDIHNMYQPDENKESTEKDADINITGETKVINGYECEKWVFKDNGKEVTAWMAKGLGGFFMFQNPMEQSTKAGWQQKLEAGSYFPMQVFEGGKLVMEVTSVEAKSLKDDLFSAPAGFQKFDMPGMNMYK